MSLITHCIGKSAINKILLSKRINNEQIKYLVLNWFDFFCNIILFIEQKHWKNG